MPTYQYACKNPDCGNQFELVQSFTDPAASECPVCGAPVRKVFGAVGVVFKGSGFYRTDSRASSAKPESNGSGSNGSGSNGSGSKESGSKESGPKESGSADKKSDAAGKPAEKKSAATGSGSAGKAAATA